MQGGELFPDLALSLTTRRSNHCNIAGAEHNVHCPYGRITVFHRCRDQLERGSRFHQQLQLGLIQSDSWTHVRNALEVSRYTCKRRFTLFF